MTLLWPFHCSTHCIPPPCQEGHVLHLSPAAQTRPHEGETLVAKVCDWDPEGCWFKPWCSHNMISAAVGPLTTLLQGDWLLPRLINCKLVLHKNVS